jgi:hypothetical protein
MSKLYMKVCKTVITEFEIDLDDWYSWESMTEKERYQQINSCLDAADDLLADGGVKNLDVDQEVEVLDWDIEK